MDITAINFSIAICSARPFSVLATLTSILPQLDQSDEILLIFDTPVDITLRELFLFYQQRYSIQIYYNQTNKGLSYCRNLALVKAKNPFLIFFDDDVIVPLPTFNRYRLLFKTGYSLIGGPLKLPSYYKGLPWWLPVGMSSLLGIHTVQERIWGANFGFDLQIARKHSLTFQENLGRKGKGLQSGDETQFIVSYLAAEGRDCFSKELFVYHCIDINRFTFSYLWRRSFWQGRSECRKNSFKTGIKKEFIRSNLLQHPQKSCRLIQRIIGFTFFSAFGLGALFEYLTRLTIRSPRKWD
jgi:hypothetical protein